MYTLNIYKSLKIKFELQLGMKKLENPTTYFFRQAENTTKTFSKRLQNREKCQLCTKKYDTQTRLPRILVHCGHTFCCVCLAKFYTNRRVRCPMCLKLVKYIDSLQRLPINHTIFKDLVEKENMKNIENGDDDRVQDAQKFLYGEFERVQKQAHMMENPQKIDQESGMPYCVFHSDRVEHFYCESHKTTGCRVCIEIGHSKSDCKVIDLYNVEDPQKYLNPMEQRIQDPDLSEPFISMNKKSNMLGGLMDDDQDEDLVDDSESSPSIGRKSA